GAEDAAGPAARARAGAQGGVADGFGWQRGAHAGSGLCAQAGADRAQGAGNAARRVRRRCADRLCRSRTPCQPGARAAGAPGGIAAAAVRGTGAPAAAARSAIAARTFDQRTLEYLIHRSYSRLPPGYPSDIRLPAAPYSLTRP